VGEVRLGKGRLNAPTIAPDGTLYVTTYEGRSLEAVRTSARGLAPGSWTSFAGGGTRSVALPRP
jgi:hypothetical protein